MPNALIMNELQRKLKSIPWEEAELFHILFVRYPAIFIFKCECESEYETEELTAP